MVKNMVKSDERTGAPVASGTLWFGVLGAPVVWGARLVASYALVAPVCRGGGGLVLHLASAAALGVSLIALLVAWRSYQATRPAERPPAERAGPVDPWVLDRARFMAVLGLLMSAFFALVIVAEWSGVFVTDPCVIR